MNPWQYISVLYRKGNTIMVELQLIVPPGVEGNVQANQMSAKVIEELFEEESIPPLPSFGPRPDTTKDCNFEDEVARLPFKFNLGDTPFNKEQQNGLLNLIYYQ